MANDKSLKVKNGLSAKRYMQGAGTATASTNTAGPVDAFSTDLYTGDGTTSKKITNDIDLSTDGGLVWIKRRSDTSDHRLIDTEEGASSYLASNTQDGYGTGALSSFDTDGFTIGDASAPINAGNGSTYVAWSFKQQSSFFDVVSYTGSFPSQTVSHNLNSTVGAIFAKRTNTTGNDWAVYHRGLDATSPEDYALDLNTNDAVYTTPYTWNGTAPTTSTFSVGNSVLTNNNGDPYIAYVFAHDTSDDSYIKCGSYTGNGSNTGPEIDLGFKPQWLLVKRINASGYDWNIFDSERGINSGANDPGLYANTTAAESSPDGFFDLLPNGFQYNNPSGVGGLNDSGAEVIYIAIREGVTNYSQTIDLSTGHYFSVTMSNPTTFSFTNPPASGVATSFVIELNNNESAITWPSSVKWAGGEAPAATSTKDIYKFITTDGGTTYYGALSGGAMA